MHMHMPMPLHMDGKKEKEAFIFQQRWLWLQVLSYYQLNPNAKVKKTYHLTKPNTSLHAEETADPTRRLKVKLMAHHGWLSRWNSWDKRAGTHIRWDMVHIALGETHIRELDRELAFGFGVSHWYIQTQRNKNLYYYFIRILNSKIRTKSQPSFPFSFCGKRGLITWCCGFWFLNSYSDNNLFKIGISIFNEAKAYNQSQNIQMGFQWEGRRIKAKKNTEKQQPTNSHP